MLGKKWKDRQKIKSKIIFTKIISISKDHKNLTTKTLYQLSTWNNVNVGNIWFHFKIVFMLLKFPFYIVIFLSTCICFVLYVFVFFPSRNKWFCILRIFFFISLKYFKKQRKKELLQKRLRGLLNQSPVPGFEYSGICEKMSSTISVYNGYVCKVVVSWWTCRRSISHDL